MTPARKPATKPAHPVDPTDEIDPFVGGTPISTLDSEGAFLSHCLMHPEQFHLFRDLLRVEHYYAVANQRVWEALLSLEPVSLNDATGVYTYDYDVTTVANRMRFTGTLTMSGGTPYLAELLNCQPASAHPERHATDIVEAWRQRMLMQCLARQAILLRRNQVDYAGAIAALRELVKMVKE